MLAIDGFTQTNSVISHLARLGHQVEKAFPTGSDVLYEIYRAQPDVLIIDAAFNAGRYGHLAAHEIHRCFNTPVICLDKTAIARVQISHGVLYLKSDADFELAISLVGQTGASRAEHAAADLECMIASDLSGRVWVLNSPAEEATGWVQAKAAGQPLNVVFRTMRGDTVRGDGAATVLLNRDGVRGPIYGGMAEALRNTAGQLVGTVLLFRFSPIPAQTRALEWSSCTPLSTAPGRRLHTGGRGKPDRIPDPDPGRSDFPQ